MIDNPYYIGLADNPEPPEEEEKPKVVAECEECGRAITADDESLAITTADGETAHWCYYCLHRLTYSPERLIGNILEAAGVFHSYGYSDDAEDACRGAAERMKVSGGVHG